MSARKPRSCTCFIARRKDRLILRRTAVKSARMASSSGDALSRMWPLASKTASMSSISSVLGSWPSTTASRRGQGMSLSAKTANTWFMMRDAVEMRRNPVSSSTLSRTPRSLISRFSSSNSSMGHPVPPDRMRCISSVSWSVRMTQVLSLLGVKVLARFSLLSHPANSRNNSRMTSNSRSSAIRSSKWSMCAPGFIRNQNGSRP